MVATIPVVSLVEVKRTKLGRFKLIEAGSTEQISSQTNADQDASEQDEQARRPLRPSQHMHKLKHESPYFMK